MSTIAISPRLTAAPRPAPPARLRLTRRGRVVFTTLAALPLVVGALVFSLIGGSAWASIEASNVSFEYATVESGHSLWQVA